MMDYTTTAQEKDYLLSLRIRSPRAKKRALRDDREKQLRKLERELKTISALQHNMGYVPLDPPVQRGWKRTFALRADVAASRNAAFYQGILDRINVKDYHHDRKFMVKKRKFGRKVKVVKELHLPKLDAWCWAKCGFSEKEKAAFDKELHYYQGRPFDVYVFRDRWRFVLKVTPNMITEVKMESIELEIREKWIDNRFTYHDSRNTLNRLHGRKGNRAWRRWFNGCWSQRLLKGTTPKNTLQWLCSLDD